MVQRPKPGIGERSKREAVATEWPGIGEAAGGGIGPAGLRGELHDNVAGQMRVGSVATVKIDAVPVNEV